MIPLRFLLPLLLPLAALADGGAGTSLPENPSDYLRAGESFNYQVGWGLFRNCASLRIDILAESLEGLAQYRVSVKASTRGLVRSIFPHDSVSHTLVDAVDGRLLAMGYDGESRRETSHDMAVFDYFKRVVVYEDYNKPKRNRTTPLPQERFTDIVGGLLAARRSTWAPGDVREMTIHYEGRFYPLRIYATGVEEVRTHGGATLCTVIEPVMTGEPVGFFKRGGRLRVWLGNDPQHLPLKLEIRMKVGTFIAMLSEHQNAPDAGKKAEGLKN